MQPVAAAVTIVFTATNLADTTPGEDLWRYQYVVTELSLAADQGLSIFFDVNLYAKIGSPPPAAHPGWSVLAVQPDVLLESDGFFDAQAVQAAPSLVNPFSLTFVWLGTGAPGAQPFTIYNADFSTASQGMTTTGNVAPLLSLIRLPSGQLQLSWTPASAVLETSVNLTIWNEVDGAVSPLMIPLGNAAAARYYRIRPVP